MKNWNIWGKVLLIAMLVLVFAFPLAKASAATLPADDSHYHQDYNQNGSNFPAGWCTAYAAIRFGERSRAPGVDWNGDALEWYANAQANGWTVTPDIAQPRVGAIVVWSGGHGEGHVAVVEAADDSGVFISEMNWEGRNILSNTTLSWGELQYRGSYVFEGYVYPGPPPLDPCTGGSDVLGATSTSRTWYFAEGYTGPGFTEYITVLNPGANPASLTLRFQTQEAGEIVKTGLTVGPNSRATLSANDLLGGSYQTSLKLESTQPVVAERPMYFNYLGMGNWHWTGGDCVLGATELAKEYFFAEGCTRAGFEEWLTIQNPGAAAITVSAVYELGAGQGTPANKSYSVPALGRITLYVPTEAGANKDVSVHLASSSTFLAERPMYFDYTYQGADWNGGHCVIGAPAISTDWFFAEGATIPGFHEWLCLQNPNQAPSTAQVSYFIQGQSAPAAKTVTVPANSRITLFVNDHAGAGLQLSARVHISSGPGIIAERPMYFAYGGTWTGGSCALGATAPATSYYFAEGTCRPSFDAYLTLQNPGGTDAAVTLNFMKGDGSLATQSVTVPKNSRMTFNASSLLGKGDDIAHDFSTAVNCTNGQAIVAERPLYFNYGGPLPGFVVCLDPGHADTASWIDPDTGLNTQDWSNEPEMDIVFDIALRAQSILREDGIAVVMTKTYVTEPVDLKQRAEIANNAGAALILHIHTDPGVSGPTTDFPGASPYDWKANSTTGRTAYIAPAVQQASQNLAPVFQQAMASSLASLTGASGGGLVVENRGDTGTGNYGPLLSYDVWSQVPTFTLENNQAFADTHRQAIAESIAYGILACLRTISRV